MDLGSSRGSSVLWPLPPNVASRWGSAHRYYKQMENKIFIYIKKIHPKDILVTSKSSIIKCFESTAK